VPEELQRSLSASDDPASTGLTHARALLRALPERVAGVHMIPPYRKPERMLQVLRDLEVATLNGRALTAGE
jgi:hypothetical protein